MKILATGFLAVGLGAKLMHGAQAEGSFDRSLSVSGPVELDVKTDSGGIQVTPGHSGAVHVHATLKAQGGWFGSGDVEAQIREIERNPPVEQSGNRIRIGYLQHRELLRNVSMHLEIETPAETQVHAHADSGGIQVRGMSRPVDCKTDSGGVTVENISGEVRAAADSGGIHIRDIHGAVFVRVDSGGITAENIAGPVEAQADSGHIQISQTTPASIRAKADSGGIKIALAQGAGYDVDAEADSGRITVPELTTNADFSRHHVQGKVHGGGPLVSAHVESGGVTISDR